MTVRSYLRDPRKPVVFLPVYFGYERIVEASQSKSEFIANISHELRTPLNAVIGFAELACSDTGSPLPPGQRERIEYIAHAGEQLQALMSDVIDLNRLGGLVLLGVVLSQTVAPGWIWRGGFVGAGLVFAGISGFCGMARLLAVMPWNRVAA